MRLIDADALIDRIKNPYEQAQVARWVNEQPTIEPEKRTEERTETHACDLIDRQAAIDALEQIFDRCEEIEAHLPEGDPDRTGYKMYPDYMTVWKYLHQLPSAQQEIIQCKDCKYRYIDEKFGPSCELDTGDPYATGRNADEDNWFCADAERRTDG